jgi:aspartyl-tRNA(Asn)/glutamyl-tRNA(Gln) amidotransferase subunit C
MKLTIEEVEHIAGLARLELSEAEKARFAGQLSDIFDYATRLDEPDTSRIAPTARVLETPLRLRKDVPRPGLSPDAVLANSPETEDGQFKVPPVLEG